jgi:hypothetical protein
VLVLGDEESPTIMADITFSFSKNQSKAVFSANTPKGEEWMAESEITMPISDAKEYIESARSVGLIVLMFS